MNNLPNSSAEASDGKKPDVPRIEDQVVNVGLMERRLVNIERIAESFENVAAQAVELGKKYFELKADEQRASLETEDKQHKRSTQTILILVGAVFAFCLVALVMHQNDLVKTVFQSSIAVAAGAGLVGLWKPKPRRGGDGE